MMASESPQQSGTLRDVPNVWGLSAGRNPYLHNVFALLGIDPDEGEKAFARKCRSIVGRLRAGQELIAHGRQIEETDLARAEDLTANEVKYVAERLLAHTSHKVDVNVFQESVAAIEALSFDSPGDLLPLPIRDLTFLTRLLPELVDVAGGEPQPVTAERLAELAQPDAADEKVFDL